MPVHYTLRENSGLVHVRARGRFSSEEINKFLVRLAADPQVKADHVTLFDTTGADSVVIDDDEFGDVMDLKRQYPEKLISKKVAILLKDKRFVRNALAYQRVSATIGQPTQVFTSLVEATNWLLC